MKRLALALVALAPLALATGCGTFGKCGPGGACGDGCGPGGCGPAGRLGAHLSGHLGGHLAGGHGDPGIDGCHPRMRPLKRHHGRHAGYDPGAYGPPSAAIAYPYYTTRGPRDYFAANPPSIGR